MNKSNITFEVANITVNIFFWNLLNTQVLNLSTCVFKRFQKNIFTVIFVIRAFGWKLEEGFGWNNVGPTSLAVVQHYTSIGPMYRVFCVTGIAMPQFQQTLDNHTMLFQCWVSVGDCWSTLKQH